MQDNQVYKKTILFFITISIWLAPALSAMAQDKSVLSLPEAVRTAVENHSKIKEATENLKSAAFEKKSAKAEMFPKALVNYSYTHLGKEPFQWMDMGPAGKKAVPVAHSDQYHWDVTLIQPLFTGFALTTRYDMAKLEVEVKKQEKRQAVLDVIQGVKQAYFNVLLSKKILIVADDAVKSLRSHERDAKRLYDYGIIRHNDLLSAKVALADVTQNREKAGAGVQMAVSGLNSHLGFDINRNTLIEKIEAVSVTDYRLEDLMKEGMENRPVLKILRLGIKILTRAVKLEKSSYYPEVALIGCYRQDGDNPGATDNDFGNDYNTSVTVQARWTFFESGKTRARVNKIRHDRRALFEKISWIEDGIKLEIKNAWLNLGVAEKNIKTSKSSLDQARENWRITNLGYNQQVATSTEVLDARTDLTQAETNYYRALYGYLDALVQLEHATGKETEI